jgi:IAA-amino acid hydrolase
MLERARDLYPQLVEWRRQIHTHPELGFQEEKTAALVAETLTRLGLRVQTNVGITGVVGFLGEGAPTVALRADMDALPIQEANDVPYASQTPGVMHACGHDFHTAMLLGVATLLSETPPPRGQVRFLFQPLEEGIDAEGKSGAMRMVDDGALEGVDAIFGLHVYADMPSGTIGIVPGPAMAASDTFRLTVRGRGGHGAYPHKSVDPIVLAAQVINAIQTVVARRISPIEAGVITVGSIHAGTVGNIIPEEAVMTGTIRSFKPHIRKQLFAGLERAAEVARTLGGDFEIEIMPCYPVTANDPQMAALVHEVATTVVGADKVFQPQPETGAEDFSVYLERVPGCYFRLGAAIPGDDTPRPHHNPRFDADEEAMPLGVTMLATVAEYYLDRAPVAGEG